jgi:hypothetical protein
VRTPKRIAAALIIAGLSAVGVLSAPAARAATAPSAAHGLAVAQKVFAASSPRAAYNGLSAADKYAFKQVETPASVTNVNSTVRGIGALAGKTAPNLASAEAVAFSGCWALTDTWAEKAAAGNTLFTYWQATEVCVSGGKVTNPIYVYNYDSETSTPGWSSYQGATTGKFNASWEGRGLVRVYYHLTIPVYGVIQTVSPCGQLRLNANGYSYAVSSSCNLN